MLFMVVFFVFWDVIHLLISLLSVFVMLSEVYFNVNRNLWNVNKK